jgi:hypothetical protein
MREKLAALAHEQWSGWMRYLFERSHRAEEGGEVAPGGSVVIPSASVVRWRRLMDTPYGKLTEQEKESDRAEADRVLAEIKALRDAAREVVCVGREYSRPPLSDAIDKLEALL